MGYIWRHICHPSLNGILKELYLDKQQTITNPDGTIQFQWLQVGQDVPGGETIVYQLYPVGPVIFNSLSTIRYELSYKFQIYNYTSNTNYTVKPSTTTWYDGWITLFQCNPDDLFSEPMNITIPQNSITLQTPSSLESPPPIDVITASWLVASVLAAAFAFKVLRRTL